MGNPCKRCQLCKKYVHDYKHFEGCKDGSGLECFILSLGHLQTQSLLLSKMMTFALGGSTITCTPVTRVRLEVNCSTSLSHIISFIISISWHCLMSAVLNIRIPEVER